MAVDTVVTLSRSVAPAGMTPRRTLSPWAMGAFESAPMAPPFAAVCSVYGRPCALPHGVAPTLPRGFAFLVIVAMMGLRNSVFRTVESGPKH
ncbi:hypothetical protein D3C71_2062910 [compost metagenome]